MFTKRMRSMLAVATALTLMVPMAGTAEAGATAKEKRLFRMVNNARENHGLRALKMGARLRKKAHRHAIRMARQGRIFHHSCLSCLPPGNGWSRVAENVARAKSVHGAHRKLMNSGTHRSNILCGCFKKIGTGVAKRGGKFYVVEIFVG